MSTKVVQLSTVHYINDVRIFSKEAITLSKNNFEVHLIGLVYKGIDLNIKNNIIYHPLKKITNSRIINSIINIPISFYKILKINPSVIHFHDPELIFSGIFFHLLGYNVIYDVHEDLPKDVYYKNIPRAFKKPISFLMSLIEKYSSSIFKNVITVTPIIQSRFEKYTENSIKIANYPHEFNYLNKNKHVNNYNLCYVGSIDESRGIFQILEIINSFNGKINLNLCGEFSSKDLFERAKNHPAWKWVIYHGLLPHNKVFKIISDSFLGLLILSNRKTFEESYPIKLFEYMSRGIPVLASDFEYWKNQFEKHDCIYFCDPKNQSKLNKMVLDAINNREKSKKMGINGRIAYLKNYTWKVEAKKLISFYNKILE
tara:strand:+ start:13727 stop:14839 length:1113 start_codon:yes stop_codon:yes gene_type:complete